MEISVPATEISRILPAMGGSAESWLHMQANHDLWLAERSLRHTVTKIAPLKQVA
jgi:plasmid maintenance system antidote protein VapI